MGLGLPLAPGIEPLGTSAGAPLVLALHGYTGNQDYFFSLVKDLPALCDKYGFIFVAPMGYTTGNWYGAPTLGS